MVQKLFTIIIPTKNRADTLYWALRTCVEQEYENLRIIISDNCSTDNTREVALSFNDARVKYINTGTPLSMSGNWEYALSQVNDGYVSYLGDDDGFLPGAIKAVNNIINETNCDAVGSACIEYNWPNHLNPIHRNKLFFVEYNVDALPDTKALLVEVLHSRLPYTVLPWLYKGFVSMEILKEIRNKSSRFFNSRTPDVYSAIVLANAIGKNKFYYSQQPFAINGASSHSNGISLGLKTKNAGAKEFVSALSIPFHQKLVLAKSFPIYLFECYLQAKDAGAIDPKGKELIELEDVLKNTMEQAQYNKIASYQEIVEAVIEIGNKNNLSQQKINHILHRYPNRSAFSKMLSKTKNRYFSKTRQLDMNKYKVENVYEACIFASKIIKGSLKAESSRPISLMAKDIKTIITKR